MKNNDKLGVFTPKGEVSKELFNEAVSNVSETINAYANKKAINILDEIKGRVFGFIVDDSKCLNKTDAISDFVELLDSFINKLKN